MQEIKKRRIVIASVLKPVDDTRMFEKMGRSLAEKHEVHIIGYPTLTLPPAASVTFHALSPFRRISIARLLAPFRILIQLFKIQPEVMILNTHELLLAGVLYKIFKGVSIIYDVRENYFRNILYTKTFFPIIRPGIAIYVRMKEYILSPFITHFLLAEKNYQEELNFIGKRATVVENKVLRPSARKVLQKKPPHQQQHFIFSGTIAASTGIFIALDIVDKLYAANQNIYLTIIGYCAQQQTLLKIRERIKDKPYITLIGGNHLVPHAEILKAIQEADIGIVSYPPNLSTSGSIPTKLYEYLGYHLPMLLIDHEPWVKVCAPYSAAIPFQPETFNANVVLNDIQTKVFYQKPMSGIFWDEESPKLLRITEACSLRFIHFI